MLGVTVLRQQGAVICLVRVSDTLTVEEMQQLGELLKKAKNSKNLLYVLSVVVEPVWVEGFRAATAALTEIGGGEINFFFSHTPNKILGFLTGMTMHFLGRVPSYQGNTPEEVINRFCQHCRSFGFDLDAIRQRYLNIVSGVEKPEIVIHSQPTNIA